MFSSPFSKACKITTPYKKKGSWACGYHTGIDLIPTDGDKNPTLYAPCDCTILSVNSCGSSYGNHICASTGTGYIFVMAHMKSVPPVKKGDKVKKGQKVGIMGNTGNSFGEHLHIEFQKAKSYSYAKNLVNPTSIMDITKKAVPVTISKKVYKHTTAKINLREKVGKTDVLCVIPKGTKVEVLKSNAGKKDGYTWAKIKYSGKTGYAATAYLK